VKIIENFEHKVGSHCESGSLRNLLAHRGMDVSEPMVFGVGSGPLFAYVFFVKGPATFPLLGLRNPPSGILKGFGKLCDVSLVREKHRTTLDAMTRADELLDSNIPVAASVDMFYMKYLPAFMRVHAPSHFIVLVGRDEESYAVSDPYYDGIGVLTKQDLAAAWDTHAPMAKDNFLCFIDGIPESVDWRRACKKAIIWTCRQMLMPPGIRYLLPFLGVRGIRFYARRMLNWTAKYRGPVLREGIMFQAVTFEDQGTGGGGFRLMYGAFLQEAAGMFESEELGELAQRMIAHGQGWRRLSRKVVMLGKLVPTDDDAYDDWFAEHGVELEQGLRDVSQNFMEYASFEGQIFKELQKAASRL